MLKRLLALLACLAFSGSVSAQTTGGTLYDYEVLGSRVYTTWELTDRANPPAWQAYAIRVTYDYTNVNPILYPSPEFVETSETIGPFYVGSSPIYAFSEMGVELEWPAGYNGSWTAHATVVWGHYRSDGIFIPDYEQNIDNPGSPYVIQPPPY